MKENYADAKEKLRECLTYDPNTLLRGFAVNNLAVASWWHKMPGLKEFVGNDEGEEGTITPTEDAYTEE